MAADMPLVTTIAAGLGVALVFGFITQKMRLSPILGYLLAGIVVGPYTPGIRADLAIAQQLAEIGVMLLMFGVGLHFHLKDLLAVKGVAVPGAVGQSIVATGLGILLAWALGWNIGEGVVLGIGLSVASTVVLMRGLEDSNQFSTPPGHIAVGWLIVEDLFTVIALVLLPAVTLASRAGDGAGTVIWELAKAIGLVSAFALLMLGPGAKVIPWVLGHVARTRSRELFTLTVLALAISLAVGSTYVGSSMALGAFLAGMVVGQSKVSHQAAADALPMRDAFAVLFFVSVGMLFDPSFVVERPLLVAGALAIVLIGKPLAAIVIVLALGKSVRTALVVAIGLAQIGEFSFILASEGMRLEIFRQDGQTALVAAALISITLNPLLFRAIPAIERWLQRRPKLYGMLQRRSEKRAMEASNMTMVRTAAELGRVHAVVVGYGPVGQTVARILREFKIEPVVIDMNVDTVNKLAGEGRAAVFGDASRPEVLKAAGIEKARYLLVTLPELAARIPVIIAARDLNPELRVLARARFVREGPMLEEIGVHVISYEESEAAVSLAAHMLRECGADNAHIAIEARKIRESLEPANVSPL